ncbi:hypothetical protein [Pseudophaeobacter flagellatus]|uniref:hypothetical protein n=1 Tax=Pseudophaeobacter flagellatus TaxID=2899119 RepID=UPI001E291790|nr:hypothetical protein [Pseudophaeobacter flagellatus]MCD9148486.1 hypothetical protein [Pseudophaeobacter flagellatus]
MKRLKSLREWLWPVLELLPTDKEQEEERLARDKKSIEALELSTASDAAVDEARRFSDAEDERRRGADQKATTYLAVVAALVPLIVTLATAVWDKKMGAAPTWVNMLGLGAAVAYASNVGVWAFRVLEVSITYRIGVSDLVKAWKSSEPTQELARQALLCGRLNQKGVNTKITNIKMAHAFLLRAYLTFTALLMINIVYFLAASLAPVANDAFDFWVSPPQSVLAVRRKTAPMECSGQLGHLGCIGPTLSGSAVRVFLPRDCEAQICLPRCTSEYFPDEGR